MATLAGKFGAAPAPVQGAAIARGIGTATDTSDTEVIATPGSGLMLNITNLVITNSSASATEVTLKSASTTIWGPLPAPAGGGVVLPPFDPPLQCAANEAFNFAAADSVSSIIVSALGYISKA